MQTSKRLSNWLKLLFWAGVGILVLYVMHAALPFVIFVWFWVAVLCISSTILTWKIMYKIWEGTPLSDKTKKILYWLGASGCLVATALFFWLYGRTVVNTGHIFSLPAFVYFGFGSLFTYLTHQCWKEVGI